MAQPFSTPALQGRLRPAQKFARLAMGGAAALGILLLLGLVMLWAHYGTAVFFKMIASGISACF